MALPMPRLDPVTSTVPLSASIGISPYCAAAAAASSSSESVVMTVSRAVACTSAPRYLTVKHSQSIDALDDECDGDVEPVAGRQVRGRRRKIARAEQQVPA